MEAARRAVLPLAPSVSDLLRVFGVRARKQLSQNFLLDTNVTDKFVAAAGDLTQSTVFEVGGGPGTLTRSILKADPRKLVVIEKDKRMLPFLKMLEEAQPPGHTQIVHGDAVGFDYEAHLDQQVPSDQQQPSNNGIGNAAVKVIGNLPFGVATPILLSFLRDLSYGTGPFALGRACEMTLAFQLEVGRRLVAPVGDKYRSRVSVMAQSLCDVELAFVIPGSVFVPPPKIDVAVVTLKPRAVPLQGMPTFDVLEHAARALFRARRKTVANNLRLHFAGLDAQAAADLCHTCNVDPQKRPQNLNEAEVVRLAQVLAPKTSECS